MAIDRNPECKYIVHTYNHYSECESWLLETMGEWNVVWWRDFQDIAATVLGMVPQPDCYWFKNEKDAVIFRLKFG